MSGIDPIRGPRAAVVAPADTAVAHFATSIVAAWQKQVAAIVATGQLVIDAKAKLDHGQLAGLYAELPFSERTAQRLASIAAHPVLSDPTHGPDLPASWRTLAMLAKVDAGALGRFIASGTVHPDLTRAEAEDLVAQYQVARALTDDVLRRWNEIDEILFPGGGPDTGPDPDAGALTDEEQARLAEAEAVIEAGLPEYMRVLTAIQQKRYAELVIAGGDQ